MKIERVELQTENLKTHGLMFLPKDTPRPKGIAVFTHGYTASKGDQLTWATRLATEGIAGLIFDLPGHYLGQFDEVRNFDYFRDEAAALFISAREKILAKLSNYKPALTIIGGHSLGALLALKAAHYSAFKEAIIISVGFGMPPKGEKHIFQSEFFKKTLMIRNQLVSPAIHSKVIFPWIKEEKIQLKLNSHKILLLNGQDDIVVTKEGHEGMVKKLTTLGNNVTEITPKSLSHHQPEKAAPHIWSYLKQFTQE